MKRIIAPSVLSADFGNLNQDIAMLDRSRAEWVHIDVMDGVFVPNISFGFPVMKPIRKATTKVLGRSEFPPQSCACRRTSFLYPHP